MFGTDQLAGVRRPASRSCACSIELVSERDCPSRARTWFDAHGSTMQEVNCIYYIIILLDYINMILLFYFYLIFTSMWSTFYVYIHVQARPTCWRVAATLSPTCLVHWRGERARLSHACLSDANIVWRKCAHNAGNMLYIYIYIYIYIKSNNIILLYYIILLSSHIIHIFYCIIYIILYYMILN
jgi:hypothetical protein